MVKIEGRGALNENSGVRASAAGQRFIALDGLRGIAALVVVVFHYLMGYGMFTPTPRFLSVTPLNLLWDGSAAVSVFFVLSGFVLSYSHLQSGGAQAFSLRSFYISRAFRLLGPYAIAFLVSVFCLHHLFVYPLASESRGLLFLGTWIQAAAMPLSELLQEGFLLEPAIKYRVMVQSWTLSVEFYLSLLFPLLLLLMRRSTPLFIAILLLLPVYNRLPVAHPYPLMASGVVHFMLGMVLARYRAHLADLPLLRSTWRRALFFLIGVICLSVRHTLVPLGSFNPFGTELWDVAAFGAFVVVWAALESAPFRRLLSTPLFGWLGRVSYSLYLVHIVVLYLLVPKVIQVAAALGGGSTVVWLVGMAGAMVLSLAAAEVFYWAVERPCIRFAKAVARPRDRISPMASEAAS